MMNGTGTAPRWYRLVLENAKMMKVTDFWFKRALPTGSTYYNHYGEDCIVDVCLYQEEVDELVGYLRSVGIDSEPVAMDNWRDR